MSTATVNESNSDHSEHPPRPYLEVFIALFVMTIIEVGIGYLDTTPLKVTVLILMAVAKAALVAAFFMHVKYDKNPRQIVILTFIVPLLGAILLGGTIYADYRV